MLPTYLNNLVSGNPGTLAALHTESTEQGEVRFKYMFLAFGASIQGYESMRKVVVVDGTHLKGRYAGCLLTASAQDGNYQIFPFAFAVVDSENDTSWEWFFCQLKGFVQNEIVLVIVSDRHPSINKAISKVLKSYVDLLFYVTGFTFGFMLVGCVSQLFSELDIYYF